MTLADEDTSSILTDNANRAFQGMQVMPVIHVIQVMDVIQVIESEKVTISSGQFGTDASGAIWWPNLQLMQVVSSGGQICN